MFVLNYDYEKQQYILTLEQLLIYQFINVAKIKIQYYNNGPIKIKIKHFLNHSQNHLIVFVRTIFSFLHLYVYSFPITHSFGCFREGIQKNDTENGHKWRKIEILISFLIGYNLLNTKPVRKFIIKLLLSLQIKLIYLNILEKVKCRHILFHISKSIFQQKII